MTDTETPQIPKAHVIRRRWPGLVWAVPGAALLVVAYLGIVALANRGTDVTVIFDGASGVSVGDTKVVEDGVEVGHVSAVRIASDNRHVELTLHLERRVEPALDADTKFWMIGANPSISDLQSVKAAIAGITIGMEPGRGGAEQRHFIGLRQAPILPFDAKGRVFTLFAQHLGTITRGASIRYRGQEIGKVTETAMGGDDQFRITLWVYAPYDRLVRQGAEFWAASPLRVKLGGGGFSTEIAPASLLAGAIQFDLPQEDRQGPLLPSTAPLTLFDDQNSAEQGMPGPEIPYTVVLRGEAGDMTDGASVTMLGYQLGEVGSPRLRFGADGTPYTVATVRLYARKLGVMLGDTASDAAWRGATDAAVSRLLRLGYRAKLIQSPPFVGAHSIALARDPAAGPARLGAGEGPYPLLPVSEAKGGDMDDILAKVDQIMTKINRMPLEKIGGNVQALTANLRDITATAKPKVGPLLDKLNATATQLDATAAAARPLLTGEGANQGESLPETVRELGDMARSLRAMTDYLGRHPEALLRGKSKEKAK